MPKLERDFQSKLILEIETKYPGCVIIKNDGCQGYPDLLILYGDRWAALECKRTKNAEKQPNQEYYVDEFNKMSFSRFIYPENKEEVLHELQQAFGVGRAARFSGSE